MVTRSFNNSGFIGICDVVAAAMLDVVYGWGMINTDDYNRKINALVIDNI